MKKIVTLIISIFFLITIIPTKVVRADTVINIPDANLANALSDIIGKPADAITDDDMKALTGTLTIANKNISDITGLEQATNITGLYLYTNNISNIAPLAFLTSLTQLNVQDNPISDLSPLGSLVNITELSLPSDRTFANYQAMDSLTKLQQLYAPQNNISDISFMKNMTDLTRIDLSNNGVSNLSPLSGLTKLDYVDLTNNNIDDLKPLLDSKHMTNLSVGGNNKLNDEDIKDLEVLTKLQRLQIGNSDIRDISPIAAMTDLRLFNVQASKVEDVSVLSGLTSLENVYIQKNYITDLSPISALTNLVDTFVHVEGNFINTFSGSNKAILDKLGITTFREPQNRIGLDPNGQQRFTINVGETTDTPIYILQSDVDNSWTLINGIPGNDISLQSSDNSIAIAEVSREGVPYVTGVSGGTVQITATFKGINSEYTTTEFNVTVNEPEEKGSVTVKYQDENGTDITTPDISSDLSPGTYIRNAKNFIGYTLNDSSIKSIELTESMPNQTIVFRYKKDVVPVEVKGSLIVKYQDENGTDITTPDISSDLSLGTYIRNAKNFIGYTLNDSSTKSIELTESMPNQTIVFRYNKDVVSIEVKGSITIKYQEESGKDITSAELKDNLELGSYTETSKSLAGYLLVGEGSKTIELTGSNKDQIITFKYKKIVGIVEGTVTDSNGNPIEGVKIELHSNPQYTTTDENGFYQFTNVDLGEHTIKIIDANYKTIKEIKISVEVDKNNEPVTKTVSGISEASQKLSLNEDSNKKVINFVVVPLNIDELPQTGDKTNQNHGYAALLLIGTFATLNFMYRKNR